jgi:hypothetical protein
LIKEGATFSQLNFDPKSNGMTISKSLNLFGELRDMQLGNSNIYSEQYIYNYHNVMNRH